MDQLLNQTFNCDNTEISAYHLSDKIKNNFRYINARWSSGNMSVYVSADSIQYNLICTKHPEAVSSTRTKVFISFVNNDKRKIETKYLLDTCDYEKHIPRLDIDSYAARKVYQLFQDSKGYFETLDSLESLLMNDSKMDKTTSKILAYTFAQMRTETPDHHTSPEYFDELIELGYKKQKKIKNPFAAKEKE